ncbi:hypothetical protein EDC01DRAFT_631859 [Geopyxis carbonaria]|nr:hypothetical protein EDC01DRAFT_631859 [Geopyxis carbonaria]
MILIINNHTTDTLMMSSRIFVKGLPHNISEGQFKSHFNQFAPTTDVRLIPHRRLGYIGYSSEADAAAAVKYFNKSYIQTSKIGVELANPIGDTSEFAKQKHPKTEYHPSLNNTDSATTSPCKRKMDVVEQDDEPPKKKLNDFLRTMASTSKSKTWANEESVLQPADNIASDSVSIGNSKLLLHPELPEQPSASEEHTYVAPTPQVENNYSALHLSETDWLRSKTSRVLDLANEQSVHTAEQFQPTAVHPTDHSSINEGNPKSPELNHVSVELAKQGLPDNTRTGRLFVRNLSYSVTEDDLRAHFGAFGKLEEVHLPIDKKSHSKPENAARALKERDRHDFQGRLLHIIPAAPKRESKLDEFTIAKLPLKKQRELKRKAGATSTQFSWNTMYMNADAVVSSIASSLGVNKADFLDPTSADAAVRQAHAETHIIQETKAFFQQNGVVLDAFKTHEKDDRIIFLKNFPYGTTSEELRNLLMEYGELSRFLFPPAGTIAIAEYKLATEARVAFSGLAYRRFKGGILLLEKGPKDLFLATSKTVPVGATTVTADTDNEKLSEDSSPNATTIYIRNLNFRTTTEVLATALGSLEGFLWCRVKTKTHSKDSTKSLSMGFGFAGFSNALYAQKAVSTMDGRLLEDHRLSVKIAHHGAEHKSEAVTKDNKPQHRKIIIKNLPFEATKKDIFSLFSFYGTLRTVRMPKKLGNRTRGFAFAEFVTAQEASNAMQALRDTHLLGRRLVLDYATEATGNAEEEIERMSTKVSQQTDIVALAKLKANRKHMNNIDDMNVDDGFE